MSCMKTEKVELDISDLTDSEQMDSNSIQISKEENNFSEGIILLPKLTM